MQGCWTDLFTAIFVVAYELRFGETMSDTLEETLRIRPGLPARARK